MQSEVRQLRELCILIADCPHSTPVWTDSGYVVVRNQNIKSGRLDLSAPSFTDAEHFAHRVRRAKPAAGDIIFTREAPMGEVCMVPPGLECCVGQRQVLLRPDPKVVDGRFLLFALQSPQVQHEIGWNEGTGSTVSNVRIPVLEALRIPTPPLEVQREVGEILGALDDRIELLRQTNATLESIAQALFKSWFIDFDPVRAKSEGREPFGLDVATAALFPADVKTWKQASPRVPVSELISKGILTIGDGYRAKNEELGYPGVPFVRAGDLLQGRITPTADHLLNLSLVRARGKSALPGDTAFTSKGTIGRFAYVDDTAGNAVYSPQVCFWRSQDHTQLAPAFLHFWMKSTLFSTQVDKVKGQAAIMDFVINLAIKYIIICY